ncbi:MAG TPA: amidase family protein [Vicinamibacterales bacterium]
MDICSLSAIELARLIRTGSLSARDVVDAYLRRIEAINPAVNAIVTLAADEAIEGARAADERLARGEVVGPLHGLPIAHKDLQATSGVRTTFGSPIFRDHVPAEDSPLVARLKRAGAITIGKTNTPEFGAGSQTFNPVFGPTLNPYDTTKTCGGSSGGAAVALACRMLPLADGTDVGGSLRNPAAFCGVVGLRPSPELVGADLSSGWASLSVDGPMARSVADVALLLDAIRVPDSRHGDRLTAVRGRSFEGVRIAWANPLRGVVFDPRVVDAVDRRRPLFESLGCVTEAGGPDLSDADGIFRTLRAKAFLEKHGATVRQHGTLVKDTVRDEVASGAQLSPADVEAAERARHALRKRIARFMDRYEFFVLPTTQVLPFDVREPFVREIAGTAMRSYIDWMKSCYLVSTIGHPAISVPCALVDGLPVGLQIVGRAGDDRGVLQLAHAFEEARGPFPGPRLDL